MNLKSFLVVNFGCRVNAAESNQFAQNLLSQGLTPAAKDQVPDVIFVNTCAITQKGEYESLARIRTLSSTYPQARIIVSGCADTDKVRHLPRVTVHSNQAKENILGPLDCSYTTQIDDKYTHSHKYLLKIQSGCTWGCSYCIVPSRRPYLWSLPIQSAVSAVNLAVKQGYRELIITGVNLNQYQYGFTGLLESLLTQTDIPLISFGSLPLNCINDKFLSLVSLYPLRITNFFHIPIQSGSDKILKLMHRLYTRKDIILIFSKIKNVLLPCQGKRIGEGFLFGTDIIVGFPGETDADFQQTYDLCQEIGFHKIHTFRFSPRPGTKAERLYHTSPKIPQSIINSRSRLIRQLVV